LQAGCPQSPQAGSTVPRFALGRTARARFPRAMRILLSLLLLACSLHAAEIHTIAGTGAKGFSGDGGPAAQAQINNPFGLTRGPDGALYVCDCENHRIRRIAPDGTISTYAGNGTAGHSGDGGPATAASMHEPYEVRFDRDGNLF